MAGCSTSYFSAIAPIVVGGLLAHFKPWLTTEEDIRNRITQRRLTLIEGSCKALQRVIAEALEIPTVAQLRGAPPREPDIIGDYISEMFRTFAVLRELEIIQGSVKRFYTTLLITASIGLVGLFLAIPFETTRPYVALASYVAIAVQLYAVVAVRYLSKRLEVYEQTT